MLTSYKYHQRANNNNHLDLKLFNSDDNRLEEQKKWLDGEIEKVLLQRQEMEQLEKVC